MRDLHLDIAWIKLYGFAGISQGQTIVLHPDVCSSSICIVDCILRVQANRSGVPSYCQGEVLFCMSAIISKLVVRNLPIQQS